MEAAPPRLMDGVGGGGGAREGWAVSGGGAGPGHFPFCPPPCVTTGEELRRQVLVSHRGSVLSFGEGRPSLVEVRCLPSHLTPWNPLQGTPGNQVNQASISPRAPSFMAIHSQV